MSMKLYPPYIEGTIPAFYGTLSDGNTSYTLTVPFSMNKGVGQNEVAGYQLKIKTIQSNEVIYNDVVFDALAAQRGSVTFTFNQNKLTKAIDVGQFFKIQLAYVDHTRQKDTGYFSTVGVIKYTTKPTVYIEGLDLSTTNNHKMSYVGVYKQDSTNADESERLYSSKFIICNEKYEELFSSDEIIHNTIKDENTNGESSEEWRHGRGLDEEEFFYVKWIATTFNKMKVETPYYRIVDKESIKSVLTADLIAENNFDNGYISLSLKGQINDFGEEDVVSGLFLLSRASSEDEYKWEELYRFSLFSEKPSRILFKDFTIKQGVHYKYAIQQYNALGLYSQRILHKTYDEYGNLTNDDIFSDFEDSFLYDGERQLKIRFNPQVASFNRNLQEQQVTTIGSQYPFFFRNGTVDYKTFPINGLISYLMDEEKLFMIEEEPIDDTLIRKGTPRTSETLSKSSTALTGENIAAERRFKMKVLEWMTNGKPKLFKSPTEGNFIVRLTNTNLSANQQVGRMLHSFTTQAVEVASYNYEGLNKAGFIHIDEPPLIRRMWKSMVLAGTDDEMINWVKRAKIGDSVPLLYYNSIKNTLWSPDSTAVDDHFEISGSLITIKAGFKTTDYLEDAQGNYILDEKGQLQPAPYGDIQSLLLYRPIYKAGPLNGEDKIHEIHFEDMLPGSEIIVTTFDPALVNLNDNLSTSSIYIGTTGTYSQTAPEGGYFTCVELPEYCRTTGLLTYGYDGTAPSAFDLVSNTTMEEVPLRQFIAPEKEWIINPDTDKGSYKNPLVVKYNREQNTMSEYRTDNLIELITDCRTEIIKFVNISIYKKETQYLFAKKSGDDWVDGPSSVNSNYPSKYYLDIQCTLPIDRTELDDYTLYDIRLVDVDFNYQEESLHDPVFLEKYFNNYFPHYRYVQGKHNWIGEQDKEDFYILTFNGEEIDLTDTASFSVSDIKEVDEIKINPGLIADFTYQARIIEYTVESNPDFNDLITAKNTWKNNVRTLENKYNALATPGKTEAEIQTLLNSIKTYQNKVKTSYKKYVKELTEALIEDGRMYQ